MTLWKNGSRTFGYVLASAITLGGLAWGAMTPVAQAQVLLQEEGTLQPMQDPYTFEGQAGQAVSIAMTSDVFDTVLSLVGPNGEEVAYNDDFARSLNSNIIITLPTSGTYTIYARSFSGLGGAYNLVVKPATPYDMAYARGIESSRNGATDEAIAAFTEAIRLDGSQPMAYLDRGDAYYYSGNMEGTIADYTRAADLYEQAGNTDMANSLREQINYIQNPPEAAPMPMPY